jgi:ElaB/YqjD/DUF883 family membrane-anchored ribosome-binding protein
MDPKELNETLVKLRDELGRVDQTDETSRETLQKLDGDIHRILQSTGDDPTPHHQSLRESLEDSVEYIETAHPTLTALVARVIKALSDMGI